MTEIRVRRSGLISFAIRLGSTLTGLAFVVLVTSNLTQPEFGLWQLITRVILYVLFVANILYFWTIRYRARGTVIGKTVSFGAAIFSLILTAIFVVVSFGVAASVSGGLDTNLYYFLISTPQISLYIFSGVLESILWGSVPERASFGFGIFEISKVIIGAVAVAVLHLSLTGAILAVIGAQIIQIIAVLAMTRKEYRDKISIATLSRMVKTGWVALLNQIMPLVVNFDFLIVAVVTGSTIPLAQYGAAFTYSAIITYSGYIAYGLYAGILAGVDPRKSTTQVLELQYLFMIPMVLGELILSHRLLFLFKSNGIYVSAVPILIILAVSSAFNALSQTFDNVITAIDTTDASSTTQFSVYLKSKLFLVAKINIIISVIFVLCVTIASETFHTNVTSFFGYSPDVIGIIWAIASLGMWAAAVGIKQRYVRKISRISIPMRTAAAFLIGGLGYSGIMYYLSQLIKIQGGEIIQALLILVIGGASLGVYAAIVLALSPNIRELTRYAIRSILE